MRVIIVDIDGVLANQYELYRRGARALQKPDVEPGEPMEDEEIWRYIEANPHMWVTMDPLVTADEVDKLNELQRKHVVYYATTRRFHDAQLITSSWLRGLGIYNPTVVLTRDKGLFAASVEASAAIDDRVWHAIQIRLACPGAAVSLLAQPWNTAAISLAKAVEVSLVSSLKEWIDRVESSASA